MLATTWAEYGETKGLVTLEDVVETLLGIEIVDEGHKVDDMQHLARQLWANRARALLQHTILLVRLRKPAPIPSPLGSEIRLAQVKVSPTV